MRVLAAMFVCTCVAAQTNTLLILADDVGVDMIGAYKEGTSPPPTPNIDKLAANGVLFRNAYANPICSPTRATIHTGRYSFRTGVGAVVSYGRGRPLQLDEFTLPELLDRGGYAHALIGKWHLGDARNGGYRGPNLAGWSYYAGHTWNIKAPETYYSWRKVVNGKASTSKVYATTDNVDEAIGWIKAQKKNWLCHLSFNSAHAPFHAPPQRLHTYKLQAKDPKSQPIPFYKAMVQAIDTEIGRLLRSIPAATLAQTNILFVGDNGTPGKVSEPPFINSHAKTTLYEGGVNVPWIVSGPAVKSPGREVDHLVATVDLYPTIAEFSGIDARKAVPRSIPLDGFSIVPYLRNPAQKPLRSTVYMERFNGANASAKKDGWAIRDQDHKLIRKDGNGLESFFDLANDPFEKVNLIGKLNAKQKSAYDALKAEVARLHADWMPFGAGCKASGGVPALELVGHAVPRYGKTFVTEITNLGAGATSAAGLIGLSRKTYSGKGLPLDLTFLNMPGCALRVSIDASVPLTIQGGSARWALALPNDPSLQDALFYAQGAVVDSSANGCGLAMSNAGAGRIGAR